MKLFQGESNINRINVTLSEMISNSQCDKFVLQECMYCTIMLTVGCMDGKFPKLFMMTVYGSNIIKVALKF